MEIQSAESQRLLAVHIFHASIYIRGMRVMYIVRACIQTRSEVNCCAKEGSRVCHSHILDHIQTRINPHRVPTTLNSLVTHDSTFLQEVKLSLHCCVCVCNLRLSFACIYFCFFFLRLLEDLMCVLRRQKQH